MADYAISNVPRRVVYAASGVGPYAFTFEILSQTDIAVYKASTLLTLTTDYTVTINANGTGSVTLVATAGTSNITIVGAKNIQRTSDFTTGGDLFANTLNDELDNQTIFIQQVAETAERGLKAPVTDPTDIAMTLPSKASRAGKTLAFDANGNPVVGEDIGNWRGDWASGTSYSVRDLVKDADASVYRCNTAHTSSGSTPISTNTDSAKWDLVIDASAVADAEAAQAAAEAAQLAAETAETNAETAETNAETAASAASTSATNAASSASAASSSASSASSSASAASTSATAAASSASTASTQATNAASSASAASTSASSASSSASAASTSASNASTSATNAANSATSASSSASTASTAATNAASSASAASTSATNASNSATAAASSASDAATLLDNFDDRYLGAKSSAPSVDNDGGALLTGALYFNTVDNAMKVWNGSSWLDAYASLSGALIATNNLSDLTNDATARTNLGVAIGTDVQAYSAQLQSYATNGVAMKNRIINGAMVIDQRNAGASTTPTANGTYTLDRWQMSLSNASKYSVQQSSTAPTGFSNSLLVTSLAATSLTSGDYYSVSQAIEGFNTSDLGFGTANAKTVTVSFWVRSSLTGTFGGWLQNSANNRSYPFSYTISAANTWEQKTVTIAGDTSGTWIGATNGVGLYVGFSLGMGTDRKSTANSWQAGNYRSVTGETAVVGTSGATFYITGVQFEVGTTATNFDFRDYGRELILCQRYYEYNSEPSYLTTYGSNAIANVFFKVCKRAAPTVTLVSPNSGSITTGGLTNAPWQGFYMYLAGGAGSGLFSQYTASSEL